MMEHEERGAWMIRVHQNLGKSIGGIAGELGVSEVGLLHHRLLMIGMRHFDLSTIADATGNASDVGSQIGQVASTALDLLNAINDLGPGAKGVMGIGLEFQLLKIESDAYFGMPRPEPQLPHPSVDFKISGWTTPLQHLIQLASRKQDLIKEATKRGGRISFSARVNGDHEKLLAQACRELAIEHGCDSEAVVLRMVRAVKQALSANRIKKYTGRKAVRKLA